MKKYWALVKTQFTSAAVKKADFFGLIIVNSVQILAAVILWIAIYKPDQSINGYSLQDTIMYYIFILLITYVTSTSTTDYVAKNIKSGTLSEWLLKPRSIFLSELARVFGEQSFRVLVLVPLYLVIGLIIRLVTTSVSITLESIILCALFAFIGFAVNCMLEYVIALLAFWIDEVWSLKHFKEIVTDILGGKRLPLAFFPPFMSVINNVLPFKFVYFIPLEYLMGKRFLHTTFTSDIILAVAWIAMFVIISKLLYKFGIKRYGAYGN
jgi:ABC-2 type transport system permease protein